MYLSSFASSRVPSLVFILVPDLAPSSPPNPSPSSPPNPSPSSPPNFAPSSPPQLAFIPPGTVAHMPKNNKKNEEGSSSESGLPKIHPLSTIYPDGVHSENGGGLSSTVDADYQFVEPSLQKVSKDDERELMLTWLEVKTNYAAVYGTQKTAVGPKQEGAQSAWTRAGKMLAEKGRSKEKFTTKSVAAKFRRYRSAFFETARYALSTGAGLDEKDNFVTFEEKLEHRCHGYKRMHSLFGKSPHLNPPCEAGTSAGKVSFASKGVNILTLGSSGCAYDDDESQEVSLLDAEGECDELGHELYEPLNEDEVEEEEEEWDEPLSRNHGAFQEYRSQISAPSTASRSSQPKRRRSPECSATPPPSNDKGDPKNPKPNAIRKDPPNPTLFPGHQPVKTPNGLVGMESLLAANREDRRAEAAEKRKQKEIRERMRQERFYKKLDEKAKEQQLQRDHEIRLKIFDQGWDKNTVADVLKGLGLLSRPEENADENTDVLE
ncbi:hypothetical protein EMPS_07836 [Entomortierella parvispora]|uniref:Uncharacterized protein n=1 Tax=Entomortierella parvispora TaxID=205924 RepID=A0A9P3HF99_9FUNG|nr:hypothetical protein EMPS_07836 [Entomortierella parvispora]